MSFTSLRKDLLTKPILKWAQKALPSLSDTEREALEAGEVWWDADLFTGNPDWSKLHKVKPATLSDEEKAFMAGPVETLCKMLDDWKINWQDRDLPPEVWSFIRQNKFFGMIIPKTYGGLQFSAYAHSQVIRKISSRSAVAAVTVMVPNSLGPGELLMQFGTDPQRDYWLPRLAAGQEIPCFGLTSPEAGSDAAAMIDRGEVCRGTYQGKDVLGIRLNWHKRYITLGPVATVLGLAFKLYDPQHLLGGEEDLGITVALVPTNLPGVEIGRRHLPSMQMFQNGPNWGHDVFIPMDNVIGGQGQVGKGWKMLMSALAAGRGISLPSLSCAAAAFSARTAGAYARVREQFGIPVGKFEGVQTRLGFLAATAYQLDAARRLTCAGLDEGRKLAVISAIMKSNATGLMRQSLNDAMDIHGGKAVIDGPSNYLGNLYRAIPVGITVEGANILTQSMIIFGQGSIRCHPYLLKEMLALEDKDEKKALDAFDTAFWGHVKHSFATLGRAILRSWSGNLFAPAPDVPGAVRPYYKGLSRYAASFALLSDMVLLTLGGGLKRKEMISSRLGDILSELYFLSAVLKRWADEGNREEDLPLVNYCMERGFAAIDTHYAAVLDNLPSRVTAWLVKFCTQPFGPTRRGPSDKVTRACAELLLAPSALRDRLTPDLFPGLPGDSIASLELAFELVTESQAARDTLKKNKIAFTQKGLEQGLEKGILTHDEAAALKRVQEAVSIVIAVDDFTPSEIGAKGASLKETVPANQGRVKLAADQ